MVMVMAYLMLALTSAGLNVWHEIAGRSGRTRAMASSVWDGVIRPTAMVEQRSTPIRAEERPEAQLAAGSGWRETVLDHFEHGDLASAARCLRAALLREPVGSAAGEVDEECNGESRAEILSLLLVAAESLDGAGGHEEAAASWRLALRECVLAAPQTDPELRARVQHALATSLHAAGKRARGSSQSRVRHVCASCAPRLPRSGALAAARGRSPKEAPLANVQRPRRAGKGRRPGADGRVPMKRGPRADERGLILALCWRDAGWRRRWPRWSRRWGGRMSLLGAAGCMCTWAA